MKKQYFFVGSSLPTIRVGSPTDMSFSELMFLLKVNLRRIDREKVEVIRRYYDLQNLRVLWTNEQFDQKVPEELDHYGNLDTKGLEDALMTGTGLPQYVYDFMDKYEEREELLKNFPALIAAYFINEIPTADGFLHDYLVFEHEWRLVFAGLRSKQLARDIALELQYEDLENPLVRHLLSQRDAEQYEPSELYRPLKEIFLAHQKDPLSLHQALCEYRFNLIEERLGMDTFSIDRILGFVVQLILVEKWIELDKKKGLQIIDTIVKEAK